MKLARFVEGSRILSGLVTDEEVHIFEELGEDPFTEYMKLQHPDSVKIENFWNTLVEGQTPMVYPLDWAQSRFIMPMVPSEVWIAGVTYKRSVDAREDETQVKGIYDRVYLADRPEVTFKGLGYRTVGPNDMICIRSDSGWNVPEPELTLVFGERDIVGYMVGNDVSSRDIEGENPLYLPQAKVFKNSCAIGPYLVTPEDIKDPKKLTIEIEINREEEVVFKGDIGTSEMKRSLEELRDCLFRDNPIPRGAILLTGVGVVPPDTFTLHDGDYVKIQINGLGTMNNRVYQL